MSNEPKMVEVYSANGDLEAQVIKGMLESQGITCLLQPYAVSSLQNILVPGMGGVRVLVSSEEAEQATKLIDAEGNS
ncbi:MAG: DUF2007 domain-containing protein [Chloroflexota bacterium]